MAIPALTSDGDLQHFPGAPYPKPVIRAAEKAVRGAAGWHIAPVTRQTVTVPGTGSHKLILPTKHLISVHSVQSDEEPPRTVTGWHMKARGVLLVSYGRVWATGVDYLVDMTHGYEEADDLLPLVARFCQRSLAEGLVTQRSETVGMKTTSESYNIERLAAESATSEALGRYTLPVVA